MNATGLFDDLPDAETLEARFWTYHRDNPAIYVQFCRFTQDAIDSGRPYAGAKLIFERIRWHTTVEARGAFADGFKLNNNYHAFYARLWLRDHPGHPDFFRTRRQRRVAETLSA